MNEELAILKNRKKVKDGRLKKGKKISENERKIEILKNRRK